jgi:hypothetical protein
MAAPSAAAGTEREACAEVAQGQNRQKSPPRAPSEYGELPAGKEPLPADGPELANAVHARVDMIAVAERLLRSQDLKIVQRGLEYVWDLKFGWAEDSGDEGPQIVFDDAPRPPRD